MTNNISVIIPTWNREKTLRRAIFSALNQTLPPLEILVCDDESTDGSKKLVERIEDRRVKWLKGKHSGLPAVVRNRGIRIARGNWLAFLDSDDEWLPEKLEKQLKFAKKTGCLAVCSNAYSINKQERPRRYLNYSKNAITFFDLLKVNYVICSTAIIHRSLISKCLGFPENKNLKAIEDYAFGLRIATQTNFAYIDEMLVNYFDDPSQSLRNIFQSKDINLQKKLMLEDFLDWSQKNNVSLFYRANAMKYYISASVSLFKNQFLENFKK